MNSHRFDELARVLATGRSRRQALKALLAGAVGLGVVSQTLGSASAAPATADSTADISRTSADLLARMPSEAALQKLPSNMRSASETVRNLLVQGTGAQHWSAAQLQSFRTQVEASVAQHRQLASGMSPDAGTPVCFAVCAARFVTAIGNCNGGLLCQVVALVEFDLCVVLCIL